jgi:hypothetical protein
LIEAIVSDKNIRAGLYPPKGGNPSTINGGGKKKVEFHFQVAKKVFENHQVYGVHFAAALKNARSPTSAWADKIKNRLSRLVVVLGVNDWNGTHLVQGWRRSRGDTLRKWVRQGKGLNVRQILIWQRIMSSQTSGVSDMASKELHVKDSLCLSSN